MESEKFLSNKEIKIIMDTDMDTAYVNGQNSRLRNQSFEQNPYNLIMDYDNWKNWRKGWFCQDMDMSQKKKS